MILFPFLLTNCGNSAQLSNKVCDFVTEANGNMVKLAKCYNLAQEIKEYELHTENQRKRFDKAIYRCFGGSVLNLLQGKK
jgi:hypothetical protein